MIMIGIPHTGNIRAELAHWLLGKEAIVYFSNKRPIDSNRNHIVKEFLKTDCTHLLMIDSDVVPIDNVINMVANDKPVCSAHVSTIRGGQLMPVGLSKSEGGGYHHKHQHSTEMLHKVDATGTGCIMIRRDVFDRLDKPYFKFVYDEDGLLANGEDFDFTERVGDVYFDGRYRCQHYVTSAV